MQLTLAVYCGILAIERMMNVKKFVSLILILTMCLSLCTMNASAGFSREFYSARDFYANAVSSGDDYGICTAVARMEEFIPNPSSLEEYQAIVWAVYQAALAHERCGNYEKATEYCNKYIRYAEFIQARTGEDHSENIRGFKSLLKHIDTEPELYFASKEAHDALYYGAKYEDGYGTFNGMAVSPDISADEFDKSLCNAYSLYVTFFNEDIESFAYRIPSGCKYLQLAWNVPAESRWELETVSNGGADEYIRRNLSYLATRGERVFLRFGAEVNVWEAIPGDEGSRRQYIETFKTAFRHVADMARLLAPNVAIVYSPNDISNWYVSPADFYPGDEYVDWVGISCYPNKVTNASGKKADYVDAYYCRGLYENPLIRIKEIVDNFGDRKPIYISECGFAYGRDGVQTTEHAVKMCREFYTYVNMVYPCVKGIIYFNTNHEKEFSLEANPELKNAYIQAVRNNVSIGASLNGTNAGYSKFTAIDECFDTLSLFTYAKYPNGEATYVSYAIDGTTIYSEATIPYRTDIDVSALSPGAHTLTQTVNSGTTSKVKEYVFYVGRGGRVSANPIEESILVLIDGNAVNFDQPPVAESGRVLVPLRMIFQALGASVDWNGETQTVVSQKDNVSIKLTLGENVMYVNDRQEYLDVPAKAVNGRTLVPVRAISQALNCDVKWDDVNQAVVITSK